MGGRKGRLGFRLDILSSKLRHPIMRFGVVSCTGLNSVSLPQVHVYLGPVNVTLFGNRALAAVIKLR